MKEVLGAWFDPPDWKMSRTGKVVADLDHADNAGKKREEEMEY